ncbi:methyltransferase domain-containing protein [Streptomyces sp. E11-3]|uniref:class I SAM-dependent methyltransferase n=1 Tax=Streptomyces sp. E11-3 TaxID=3110112 RepID=UPI00397FAE17
MALSRGAQEHYEGLADQYDEHWDYRPGYVPWMAARITEALQLTDGDRIADIGCGTGLFAREVQAAVRPVKPVLCVDPSAAMLRQIAEPSPTGLRPIRASAEDVAGGRVVLPYDRLDALWVKEAVHHFDDPTRTLRGLAGLLAPGGRLLVVMMPATIAYPLFEAALKRYEELQPDPRDIARQLEEVGLRVDVSYVEHELRIPRERYIDMVRARYMSVLSSFSEGEIESGVEEIKTAHTHGELVFPDRFAFVRGVVA